MKCWRTAFGRKCGFVIRIRLRIYTDREETRRNIFDYIENFYKPKRCYNHADDVSPAKFEQHYFNKLVRVY